MAQQIFKQDYGLPEPPIIEIWRREGREQGREEGREEGREQGRKQGREEGREQGREEGREEGQETLILRQLTRRFGTLPDDTIAHIQQLDNPRMLALADALLDFSQYGDLTDWLAQHTV